MRHHPLAESETRTALARGLQSGLLTCSHFHCVVVFKLAASAEMTLDGIDILCDPARMQALQDTGLLMQQATPTFDRLARLSARLLRSPIALVNLVGDKQVSVCSVSPPDWEGTRESPLSESFCKYAVLARTVLRIEDTREDPRVAGTHLVREMGIRSYLGIPLITSDEFALGTLCVADFQPRRWTDEEIETLEDLADSVTTELELRRAVRETEAAERLAEIADRERRDKTALLESTSEGIYGIDLEGRCTFINRAGAGMLGYSPEECVGRNMHALIHHSHADGSPYPEVECPIYRANRMRQSVRVIDEVLWRKDGSAFPAEYSSAPIRENGELRGAVITFSDSTERRREEAADRFLFNASKVLAASSLDYAATLRSLVRLSVPALGDWCSLYTIREGGQLERLELAHADADQEEAAQVLRRYPISTTDNDSHPAVQVLLTGEPVLLRTVGDELLRAVAVDEEHLRVLRSLNIQSGMAVPLRARGRTLGVVMLISTKPERHFSEQDLMLAEEFANRAALAIDNARLYEQSLEANRTKAEFLATISHELRTPLNAIVGYTSLMRDGIPAPLHPGSQAYLERIDLSSRHLRQLIEEVLTFSRLEAGRETINPAPVLVPQLLHDVEVIITPLASEKGLQFELQVPEDLPVVQTDAQKLRQVLLNLLDNAVKFTREGKVVLSASEEDGRVHFQVSDTGIGIRPEDQQTVFEPFQQLEQSLTRQVGGTGLGLSVAQRLAALLQAELSLQSEPGRGTTVHLWLPIAIGTPAPQPIEAGHHDG